MRAAKLCALVACLCGLAPTSAVADGVRVVILPVVVHSAAPDSSYVSRGLSDMLSARLEQLGGVDVVRPTDTTAATTSREGALAAAREARGDYVLFGSFTQFGDGASLDIQCVPVGDAEKPPRSIFIQSGTIGEIIPKLDQLALKVARYVRGEAAAQTAGVPSTSTNGAGQPEDLEELQRRLEALERAVFPPVVGATEPEDAGDVPDFVEGLPES